MCVISLHIMLKKTRWRWTNRLGWTHTYHRIWKHYKCRSTVLFFILFSGTSQPNITIIDITNTTCDRHNQVREQESVFICSLHPIYLSTYHINGARFKLFSPKWENDGLSVLDLFRWDDGSGGFLEENDRVDAIIPKEDNCLTLKMLPSRLPPATEEVIDRNNDVVSIPDQTS